MHMDIRRWTVALLAFAVLGIGTAPVLAQSSAQGSIDTKQQKIEQLKKEYAAFQKAGKAEEYEAAYSSLSEAVRLAEATDQSNALTKLQNFQQKLPTKWGNKALKAEKYDRALTHFERGTEWSPDDAYVYYGKGLALVNMDSTTAAMEALTQAIEVGNNNSDMRTATLATERIRQEVCKFGGPGEDCLVLLLDLQGRFRRPKLLCGWVLRSFDRHTAAQERAFWPRQNPRLFPARDGGILRRSVSATASEDSQCLFECLGVNAVPVTVSEPVDECDSSVD